MFIAGDRVICGTADLVRAARCEFAVLRALDVALGTVAADPALPDDLDTVRYADDPLVPPPQDSTAGRPGTEHPLADARRRHGTDSTEIHPPVPDLTRPAEYLAALSAAHERTLAVVRGGVPTVTGALFLDGDFVSRADTLVRTTPGGRYRVLGEAAEPDHIVITAIRAAACAHALECAGVSVDPLVEVRVDDRTRPIALTDALPVYRARRRRMERIVAEQLDELLPVQWSDPRYRACGRCRTCTAALTESRDLLLVAGMDSTIRARLREAGITTIDRLATSPLDLPSAVHSVVPNGIPTRTLARLRRQAEIQLRQEGSGRPEHMLLDPTTVAALPSPSSGDLALTARRVAPQRLRIELGDRTTTLFSHVIADPTSPYLSLERHHRSHVEQRRILTELFDIVADRRDHHPDLRIYHYGATVRSALLSASGRLDTGEEALDELLRAHILIDLYPFLRGAVLVGVRRYEPDRLRVLLPDSGSPNEPDSRVLLRLRDWLSARIAPAPAETGASTGPFHPNPTAPPSYPSSVEAALAEYAETARTSPTPAGRAFGAAPPRPDAPLPSDSDRASFVPGPPLDSRRVAALTAAALGYHRRERQAARWNHLDLLNRPFEEWPGISEAMVVEGGTVDTKWHLGPRGDTMRRFLTLTGRIGTGGFAPGTTVYTCYDRPAPGMRTTATAHGLATATVLGCSVDAEFADTVRLEEELAPGCAPYEDLPAAIAPRPAVYIDAIEAGVEYLGGQLLMALPTVPETAIFDILALRAPRLRTRDALPPVSGDPVAAITAALHDLDRSYLAVQAPTGTGKTAIVATVVAELVTRHHWRVGIVAPAPVVVENLLDAVVRAGVLPELVAKQDAVTVAPEWTVVPPARWPRFVENAIRGGVLGGSAKDFADPRQVPLEALDLLVIADAGVFALADAVGAAGSARNLLVLGDPATGHGRRTRSAGAHPEPVDLPVLEWLTEGRDVLPAHRGYFLDRTRRLHPSVSEPISHLYYDGRLRSEIAGTATDEPDVAEPGISTVPVPHHGNSTVSDAEAREVVRQVRILLGRSWISGASSERLRPHDIFVVTPYRAQANRVRTLLAQARIEDVLVGTPELFRGREAAVVLLSMATSTPDDAPDGMTSLISRRLVHDALCRARWKAIVIRSPLLTEYLPDTPEGLTELARFIRLA